MPRFRPVAALALGVLVSLVLGSAPARAQQSATVDDPGLSRQWGLARIGAPGAWSVATGAGVTIAVVDSGVDPTHPDLADQLLGGAAGLVDCHGPGPCVTAAESPGAGEDDAGHGTHVAGIAAASTNNGTGIAGVAPDADLLSIRALARSCNSEGRCEAEGTEEDVSEAIIWAADHGADVINLSLGSATQQLLGPGFRDALIHARSRGALPVLAAGNTPLPLGTLFDIPAVLVGGTTNADTQASYSGAMGAVTWAVAAPGGELDDSDSCAGEVPNGILSTWPDGYACVAGTSMAAPHVSGALAVLLSTGLSPEQAVARLMETADDLGTPGQDPEFGAGRINLARALGVSATGGPGAVVPDPSLPTSTAVPTTVAQAAATVPAPTTTGLPTTTTRVTPVGGPAPSGEPGAVAATYPLDPPLDDPLPALPLTAAVLAVVGMFGGHGWRYLATTSWARRTPSGNPPSRADGVTR